LISILANEMLSENIDNRSRAVACFDLGEFGRFFPQGRMMLDKFNVKMKMTSIMSSKSASSEVKKEAITCY